MATLLGRLVRVACALTIAATAVPVFAADTPANGGQVEAVWKAQSVNFEYRSSGRLYACSALEGKLRMILLRLGAREGVQLRRYSCNELIGSARYEVLLESPVEATAQNIRDITTYDSEDELVARVRGVPLPTAEDVQRFPAAWQTISFARDRKLPLDAGDCALVHQIRTQVLPKMSVQVTKDNLDCTWAMGSVARPRLAVSALVPADVATVGTGPPGVP
jgi:hypothetical protein